MSNALSANLLQARNAPNGNVSQPSGPQVSSQSLMGGASTLIIEHMGMQYTLRATRNGKLILTK